MPPQEQSQPVPQSDSTMALLLGRAGTITGPRTAPRVAQHRVVFAPVTSRPQRGALQVVAAEEQKKKRTDPAVKRAELAVERRMANRSRKSACATYIKKVGGAIARGGCGGSGARGCGLGCTAC